MKIGSHLTPANRMGLSIGVAVGLYGISFGALAVTSGLTWWQACALSLLMFTGGSQFAFIGSVGAGGLPALLSASLMGVRNAIYGAHMNAMLRPKSVVKPGYAHITIDESVATAVAQSTPDEQKRGFLTAGLAVFVLWNLFTLLGALLGNAIGDPRRFGLDGAAVAAFMALLWPRLHNRDTVAIAVVGAVVTAICVPTLPAGFPLLVAAAITAALTLWNTRNDHSAPTVEGDAA